MSKHLKRLNAPRVLKLHRKERTWTVRASPGPHPLDEAIPLGLIIRDYLDLPDTLREAKLIIFNGEVLVDGVIRKSHKFPCGLMDIVSIPKLKKDYRILFDRRGKLALVEIASKDATYKLQRIQNKTVVKGKKFQLNFHDGTNLLIANEYNTGDVLKVNFKDKKIIDTYKFEKGTVSMIIGGSHVGEVANIEEIEQNPSSNPNLAKMKGITEFSTLQNYVFPIGKNKATIELPEVKIQ